MNRRPMVIERIDERVAEILRRKTPAQRLAISFDMWRVAHDRVDYMLRTQHPDWDDKQIKTELRRRMLGSD